MEPKNDDNQKKTNAIRIVWIPNSDYNDDEFSRYMLSLLAALQLEELAQLDNMVINGDNAAGFDLIMDAYHKVQRELDI